MDWPLKVSSSRLLSQQWWRVWSWSSWLSWWWWRSGRSGGWPRRSSPPPCSPLTRNKSRSRTPAPWRPSVPGVWRHPTTDPEVNKEVEMEEESVEEAAPWSPSSAMTPPCPSLSWPPAVFQPHTPLPGPEGCPQKVDESPNQPKCILPDTLYFQTVSPATCTSCRARGQVETELPDNTQRLSDLSSVICHLCLKFLSEHSVVNNCDISIPSRPMNGHIFSTFLSLQVYCHVSFVIFVTSYKAISTLNLPSTIPLDGLAYFVINIVIVVNI